MKIIRKVSLLLVLILALAFPVAALAASGQPAPPADKVVLGGTFDLGTGQSLDGNLAVIGGAVTIGQNASVNGDVFMAGGTLTVDGTVNGNLSTLGGTVFLDQGAVVTGNVSTVGGTLHRDPASKIQGQIINGNQGPLTFNTPQTTIQSPISTALKPVTDALWFFFRTLATAGLAILLVLFLPVPLSRVGQAVVKQPVVTGGMGLLTGIIAPILLILMTITIILIPITLIGIVVLIAAVLFGWIAIGLEVGNRIAELFKSQWPAAVSAGVGTFILSLVVNGIAFIPCVGWIAPTLVGFLGLGAVLLTRFGYQPYPAPLGTYPPYYPVVPPSPAAPNQPRAEGNPPANPPEQP